MSTKTGTAPVMRITLLLATKLKGVVSTTSPKPTPRAISITWSAAVPLDTPPHDGLRHRRQPLRIPEFRDPWRYGRTSGPHHRVHVVLHDLSAGKGNTQRFHAINLFQKRPGNCRRSAPRLQERTSAGNQEQTPDPDVSGVPPPSAAVFRRYPSEETRRRSLR